MSTRSTRSPEGAAFLRRFGVAGLSGTRSPRSRSFAAYHRSRPTVTETGFHPSRIATRPTRFLGRLLTAGVWFRSALADWLDHGFKPAPVLFDAPLFGGLPFWSPLLFAKPALVLTHQLYQSILFLLICHNKEHDAWQTEHQQTIRPM